MRIGSLSKEWAVPSPGLVADHRFLLYSKNASKNVIWLYTTQQTSIGRQH